jgi:hypothetical protein
MRLRLKTELRCYECDKPNEILVEMTDFSVDLCSECLSKALALMDSQYPPNLPNPA